VFKDLSGGPSSLLLRVMDVFVLESCVLWTAIVWMVLAC